MAKKTRRPRGAKAVSTYFGIYGVRAFNPFTHKLPLPVPNCIAASSFIESSVSAGLAVSASVETILIVNFSASDIRGWVVVGTTVSEIRVENLTTSNCVEIRAGRLGLQLGNQTKANDVAGNVRCTQLTDPLNIEFATSSSITTGTKDLLNKLLDDDSRVKAYTGQQLANNPLRLVCHPVNLLKFSTHQQFNALTTGGEQANWNLGQLNSGMSQILVKLTSGGTAQNYQYQIMDQSFMRFQEGSMLANSHRTPPNNHFGFERVSQMAMRGGGGHEAPMNPAFG